MSLKLNSSGGGSVTLQEPVTASDLTLNLPATLGNTGNSMAVTSDASGNVGVGVTPSAWGSDTRALQIFNRTSLSDLQSTTQLTNNGFWNGSGWIYRETAAVGNYNISGGTHVWRSAPSGTAGNAITFTEAMRIDSSGNLLVGTTSSSSHALVKNNSSFYSTQIINNSATNPYALQLLYSGVTGGAGQAFLVCTDNANRLLIAGNGNVTNVNGSYGAISDAKLKENVTDATPKLEKLNQVRIVNFNMIGDTQKQIGVIAQELEQVFPGMVEESPDRDKDGNDLGATTKSVKYSVFVPMLIKAIQELKAELDTVKAELAAMKGTA